MLESRVSNKLHTLQLVRFSVVFALLLLRLLPEPEEQPYQHYGDIPDDHEQPESTAGQ
jgi:hypothetical protein